MIATSANLGILSSSTTQEVKEDGWYEPNQLGTPSIPFVSETPTNPTKPVCEKSPEKEPSKSKNKKYTQGYYDNCAYSSAVESDEDDVKSDIFLGRRRSSIKITEISPQVI